MTYWKEEGTIKLVRQIRWFTHLIEKAVCPFHGEPGQGDKDLQKRSDFIKI